MVLSRIDGHGSEFEVIVAQLETKNTPIVQATTPTHTSVRSCVHARTGMTKSPLLKMSAVQLCSAARPVSNVRVASTARSTNKPSQIIVTGPVPPLRIHSATAADQRA